MGIILTLYFHMITLVAIGKNDFKEQGWELPYETVTVVLARGRWNDLSYLILLRIEVFSKVNQTVHP